MSNNSFYHVSGIFNGGSALFEPNPKGWIGKTVCIEVIDDDPEKLRLHYLQIVRSKIKYMNVGSVDQVTIVKKCEYGDCCLIR
jgi:hypothetical protein